MNGNSKGKSYRVLEGGKLVEESFSLTLKREGPVFCVGKEELDGMNTEKAADELVYIRSGYVVVKLEDGNKIDINSLDCGAFVFSLGNNSSDKKSATAVVVTHYKDNAGFSFKNLKGETYSFEKLGVPVPDFNISKNVEGVQVYMLKNGKRRERPVKVDLYKKDLELVLGGTRAENLHFIENIREALDAPKGHLVVLKLDCGTPFVSEPESLSSAQRIGFIGEKSQPSHLIFMIEAGGQVVVESQDGSRFMLSAVAGGHFSLVRLAEGVFIWQMDLENQIQKAELKLGFIEGILHVYDHDKEIFKELVAPDAADWFLQEDAEVAFILHESYMDPDQLDAGSNVHVICENEVVDGIDLLGIAVNGSEDVVTLVVDGLDEPVYVRGLTSDLPTVSLDKRISEPVAVCA